MFNKFKLLILSLSILLLSGCSLTKPVSYPSINSYVLTGSNPSIAKARPTQLTILVSANSVNSLVNTTQMAYCDKPFTIAYFSKNRWANTPGQMLVPLFVQALQKTQHFKAVMMSANKSSDLLLNLQITRLQQNFLQRPSQIELTVHAEISNNNTQKLIAAHDFVIKQNTSEDTPYGGVLAANQAVDLLLQQVSLFVLQHS